MPVARRVIWVLVVVVVLAGGAVIADRVVRDQTEQRIAAQTAIAFDLDEPPAVEIVGSLFLPQVVGGTIEAVRLEAPQATVGELAMRDLTVNLSQVDVDLPYTTGHIDFSGTVPLESLPALAESDLDVRLTDGQVVVEAQLLGLPLSVRGTPVADGRAVVVHLDSVKVAGLDVPASDLPAPIAAFLADLRIEIDALPEGMVLDAVVVMGDGFRIAGSGTDVELIP